MTYDVAAVRRREFPWTERGDVIYLNNASTGPLPARTVRALHDFTAMRAEPWRVTDDLQFGTLRRTRELVARLIGASPSEIACTVNTTYGINVAVHCLPLAAGDVVLSYDREFPANVYPWMSLARRGIRFEQLPCTADGLPDERALIAALDRPQVKVVTVSWVQFASGYRTDLADLGRACRARGIFLVVDAMQGLGGAALDVRDTPIDLLACGAQKWLLGPWGAGFLYVRDALARTLEPAVVSWMAMRAAEDFTRLTDYEYAFLDDARRFELITLPYQDFAGFNASLELLHELGPAAVVEHVASLADTIVDWASARRDVRLVTPADRARRAGIVCVAPRDPRAASDRLTRAGVMHALREGAIRLSPHCYNTRDEVLRALAVLAGNAS